MPTYAMPLTVLSLIFLILPSLQDYVSQLVGFVFVVMAFMLWRTKHLDFQPVMMRNEHGVLVPKPREFYTFLDTIKSKLPRVNGSGRDRILAGTTWILWFSLVIYGVGLMAGGLTFWVFEINAVTAPFIGIVILLGSTLSLKEQKKHYRSSRARRRLNAMEGAHASTVPT